MDKTKELKKLGARLRSLRIEKGMTQSAFAKECSFDRNYIGMLERGERNPTYITLLSIAQQLGIPVSQLIG